MCGISGMFDTQGQRLFSRDLLTRINDIQAHRGPDEAGVFLAPGIALGHRRLSVIDVASGQQPLSNEDGTVYVVFNGEIYNFRALRQELEALGHRFQTRSDTEVIVHAWESWGEACVERFAGMFAFAVWDQKKNSLFLARDRLGVKPLFYSWLADGTLIFGSELKVLTAHPGVNRQIDPLAVEEFFALGYVAEPRAIYQGVLKMPPGHRLTVKTGDHRLSDPQPYWDVRFTLDNPISGEEANEALRQRLDAAVSSRLVAEVPLGAFLSGGVDSSAVVASMARQSDLPVKTCAIGFDDPAFNESDFAAMVATRYGTDHHLDIVGNDDFSLIDQLAWLYDEPFGDSSAFPTYRVCQLARQHVTVALSGDGGDESFGGYRRYRLHLMEEQGRQRLPLSLRRPLFGWLGAVYPKADWAPRVFRAKTTFQALAMNSVEAYMHSMSTLRLDEREALYAEGFKRELAGYRAVEVFRRHAAQAGTDDPLALIQYLDYKTWLVGDINTKVDRASMAHALEVREPLMDHTLVEWLATLPSSQKIRAQEGKWLLKTALEPRLPHDVLYRPKMGFSVPLARWLRGPLAGRLEKALSAGPLLETGYFNPATLQRMFRQHRAGQRDFAVPLWLLLMFDAFLRQAGQPAAPGEGA